MGADNAIPFISAPRNIMRPTLPLGPQNARLLR